MKVSLGIRPLKRLEQVARSLVRQFQWHSSRGSENEQPLVFAVTHLHAIRVVLYAAAFHGGWRIHFMKSLGAVLDVASTHRPKAVFYDHAAGGYQARGEPPTFEEIVNVVDFAEEVAGLPRVPVRG